MRPNQRNREAGQGLKSNFEKPSRCLRSVSIALPIAAALFATSCTSTGSALDVGGPSVQPVALASPSLAPTAPQAAGNEPQTVAGATVTAQPNAPKTAADLTNADPATTNPAAATAADAGVKTAEASLPAPLPAGQNPAAASVIVQGPAPVVVMTPPAAPNPATLAVANAPKPADPAQNAGETQVADAASVDPARFGADAKANAKPVDVPQPGSGQVLTAAAPQPVLEAATPPKKRGLFGNLFASKPKAQTAVASAAPEAAETPKLALVDPSQQAPAKKTATPAPETANLQLAKLESPVAASAASITDAPAVDNGELPGVRKGALFEIKRRDSLESDADVDIGETDGGPVLLASAAGMARLAPNGLKVQRESVQVACLKPQLVKMLKQIEAHYHRPVVVTSGYRSPTYNRRVRGAKNSLHMYCAAVDIQVAGVGKWELAKYARSMPNRGGVGTYCHTDSVHVDVGPDRDWNWRCARRK